MKFKDYVANLQKALNDNPELGEMETISAIDDEGNGYNAVYYDEPTVGIYDGEYNGEFYSHPEDLEERLGEGEVLNAVCIN